MSQAWKAHEKKTAEILGGVRLLRGADFGVSAPDVVAPLSFFGDYTGTIIAECKYSKNQPWIDWFYNKLDPEDDYISEEPLAIILEDNKEYYLVFDLSKETSPQFFNDLIHHIPFYPMDKSIPGYIHDYLLQAEEYFGSSEYDEPHLPIVSLGKRNSRRKLGICKFKYIEDIIANDSEHK